ncbi:helix-turn-helix transcriptional regulator [uncultured Ilyobacter sp.]|uniref:helix-turn-helix transcriptional regulator n=1 Tax=uncultured Ilyobacter sp. TaxID=544433 RepID=UPI0029C00C69|nr:helix-turn-helix transcriptional regulator [uncultured Ilyobacter sp.]
MTLSDAIKTQLKNREITQSQLAKELGVTRQSVTDTLNNWENGVTPRITTLKKWSEVINVNYEFFLKYL